MNIKMYFITVNKSDSMSVREQREYLEYNLNGREQGADPMDKILDPIGDYRLAIVSSANKDYTEFALAYICDGSVTIDDYIGNFSDISYYEIGRPNKGGN